MMASCKEASRLSSDALNRRLTLRERISLRTHLLMCEACRRFQRQLAFLHKAAEQVGTDGTGQVIALSPAARERIADHIKSADNSPRRPSRRK